jgi:hypothetical protein
MHPDHTRDPLGDPVTTTTEARSTGGFVVGQKTKYVVGLIGTVDQVGDGTVTIDGVTVPTRLTVTDGPVKYLSDIWPSEIVATESLADAIGRDLRRKGRDLRRKGVTVFIDPAEEGINVAEQENLRLHDGIIRLHDENHTGPVSVCLHEVCRQVDDRR